VRVLPGIAAGLLLVGTALAQAVPEVTDADIERARRQHRMPSDAELARVPVPSGPDLDALPQPSTKTPLDLGAIAKGFERLSNPARWDTGPVLLIFISFALPEPTLARLVDQAARSRATLLLRGLVNGSLRETVERMQRLIGQRQVSVQIDPQAFDRFGVVATPTFVLVRGGADLQPCGAGRCAAGDRFISATGDVSVDYALAFFQRSAPQWGGEASTFLQRMKAAPR
jgi:conjugal transfer pilus assembly protein TrbC